MQKDTRNLFNMLAFRIFSYATEKTSPVPVVQFANLTGVRQQALLAMRRAAMDDKEELGLVGGHRAGAGRGRRRDAGRRREVTAKLSPEMEAARQHALAAGSGKLVRSPGGFWAAADAGKDRNGVPKPWFGTTTVEALVKRGAAEYTQWKDRNWDGKPFPVEVTVKPIT